ncbi:MAG: hypothetical protein GY940_15075, partial [bacterium]|nr:hypothetical protein [bacterium]
CYEAFKTMGFDYGPAHQGLENIYVGDNEVLAKLTLPPSVLGTKDRFFLHPSLLDSALQASIGIGLSKETPGRSSAGILSRPSLPFALESLDIIGRCTESTWVWVRPVRQPGPGNGAAANIRKLDIDLCDETGNVCVKMRGFSSRVLEGESDTEQETVTSLEESAQAPAGLITMSPVWNAIVIEKRIISPEENAPMIVIGGTQKQKEAIKTFYPGARSLEIKSNANIETIGKQFEKQ